MAALTGLFALVLVAGVLPADAAAATTRESALATQLTSVINRTREARDLGTLRYDAALAAVARWRSRDMASRGYFGHAIPPTGRLVFSELDRRGYCYAIAGENIGWNTAPDSTAARSIHAMFLASTTHRKIELGHWTRMAVGVAFAPDGKRYWTVLFSRPCG